MTGSGQKIADVAQGGKVLDGKADAVEQRNLVLRSAAFGLAGVDLPEFGNRMIAVELLEFTLDMSLVRELDKDIGPQQDIAMQFGLARAVAADRIDVNAGADHVVGQDRRRFLVRGYGGDDLRAFDRIFRRLADSHVQSGIGEVAGKAQAGGAINVVGADVGDPEHVLERQALEVGLCAIADDRHRGGPLGCQVFGGKRRVGCRAQGRQDGHLGEQHRIAGRQVRQNTEAGNSLQTITGVAGMTVDILEAEGLAVTGRHQLDDTLRRMRRNTRFLVEAFPSQEILLDIFGDATHEGFDANRADIAHHVVDADEGHIGQIRRQEIDGAV